MGWRSGDLGRFRAEDPKRPRFEVIRGVKGQGVQVWYGGAARTTIIPVDTFREDCVDWWEHKVVKQPLPKWVEVGAVFGLGRRSDPSHLHLTQAEVKRIWGDRSPDKLFIEVDGQSFLVRSIRRDYVSCLMQPRGILVLVPLLEVIQRGYRTRTIWDRLMEDDPEDEEAELIRLLDDA